MEFKRTKEYRNLIKMLAASSLILVLSVVDLFVFNVSAFVAGYLYYQLTRED